ncbi:beta-ketoacyl reductase [Nocardia sp. SYP-A9097]|uniref:type I polyketide synthase n=1 Tax=Nocardia sp. SYP-A9097 TaxID=2663237 RepID=UPI0028167F6D|nr:beta-ketoacyl reductase [Nocardia sp. SYP-A9097]
MISSSTPTNRSAVQERKALVANASRVNSSMMLRNRTWRPSTVTSTFVASHGVTDLMLMSRSGMNAAGAEQLQAELQTQGANVRIVACDASKIDDLARVIDTIPTDAPLRVVISAAGHVSDGTVDTLGREQLHAVLRSKVDVAWNLHELTRHLNLEAFILFSSAAGSLGSPGQANYAAANAFLDAFAQYRQTLGLPGQSVAWGIWAQETGGMSGRLSGNDVSRIRRTGLSQMPQEVGLDMFDKVAGSAHPYLIAAAFDADRIARSSDTPGLFHRLVRKDRRATASERATRSNLLERLKELDLEGQREAVLAEIQTQAADILGYEDRLAIVGEMAFKDIGFDSLTAVEFRNRLQGIVELRLPVSTVFDHPSPARLARHLVNVLRERFPDKYGQSEDLEPAVSDSGGDPVMPATTTPLDEIEAMDVDALIDLAKPG